jgi:hypothetical protein
MGRRWREKSCSTKNVRIWECVSLLLHSGCKGYWLFYKMMAWFITKHAKHLLDRVRFEKTLFVLFHQPIWLLRSLNVDYLLWFFLIFFPQLVKKNLIGEWFFLMKKIKTRKIRKEWKRKMKRKRKRNIQYNFNIQLMRCHGHFKRKMKINIWWISKDKKNTYIHIVIHFNKLCKFNKVVFGYLYFSW